MELAEATKACQGLLDFTNAIGRGLLWLIMHCWSNKGQLRPQQFLALEQNFSRGLTYRCIRGVPDGVTI